jgi:YfiR/HmsC-like
LKANERQGVSRIRGCNCVVGNILALWCLLSVPYLAGQQPRPSAYDIEAAYLYHFSHFVEWPALPGSKETDSFLICVLGQNPFGNALAETVAHESIAGENVVAEQVLTSEDAARCRVLFISSSEESRLKQILASLNNSSVLTVSDLPSFTERGGMIQFVLQDHHVRFQINLAMAQRAGLVLSSELLKLATGVQKNSMMGN